jgi:hypothetical protein
MALKIFEASRRLAAITAQFTAAGIDIEPFIAAADETALKAHLDSLKGDASLAEQLTAAKASVTTLTAQVGSFTTALASTGITINASADKPATAADIEQAIRARASIMAGDQLAKHGLEQPLAVSPSADPVAAAPQQIDPKLTGLARVTAAFKAQRERSGV